MQPSKHSHADVLGLVPNLTGIALLLNEWQRRNLAQGAIRVCPYQIDGPDRWEVVSRDGLKDEDGEWLAKPGFYLTYIQNQHQYEIGLADKGQAERALGSAIFALRPINERLEAYKGVVERSSALLKDKDATSGDKKSAALHLEDAKAQITTLLAKAKPFLDDQEDAQKRIEAANVAIASRKETMWRFDYELSEGEELAGA